MDYKFIIGILVAVATGAAALAAARWPYNYMYELLLCVMIFFVIAVCICLVVGFLWQRLSVRGRLISTLISGVLLGAYLTLSATYFSGYLANTYPISQGIISEQKRSIDALTAELSTLKKANTSTVAALEDATKVLSDPFSVGKPAYNLPTSLRLQFNGSGDVKEVDSLNVSWIHTTIDEAHEIAAEASAPPPQPAVESPNTCLLPGALRDPLTGTCGPSSLSCPPVQCPAPGPSYRTTKSELLFISFLRPISAKSITLDSYGADVPHYSVLKLDTRSAIMLFDAVPKNVAINLSVEQ
jgi:hypothetical protein